MWVKKKNKEESIYITTAATIAAAAPAMALLADILKPAD